MKIFDLNDKTETDDEAQQAIDDGDFSIIVSAVEMLCLGGILTLALSHPDCRTTPGLGAQVEGIYMEFQPSLMRAVEYAKYAAPKMQPLCVCGKDDCPVNRMLDAMTNGGRQRPMWASLMDGIRP